MPKSFQSESVKIGKMVHEIPNSTIMSSVGHISHDEPTVFGCLNNSIQFGLEGINNFYSVIGSFVLGIPCIGKEMFDPYSDKSKQQASENSNNCFVQAIFLLIVMPLIVAFICIYQTYNVELTGARCFCARPC